MHPLHTEAWLKEAENCGIPRAHIIHRGTGKSTVQSLRVLANAIQNPGVVFKVADHHGTPRATELLLQMIRDMADKLNLQHIHINRTDQTIVFENRERDKLPLGEDMTQGPDDDSYLPPKNPLDMVNQPPHYTAGAIECIDAIRAALTPEEFRGFCKGNAIKYSWREKLKGGDEDLKKAAWYLAKVVE